MNRPEPPSEVEAYIRRLFTPDAAAVARVRDRASRGPGLRRRPYLRWAWAAAVLGTLASAVVWRARQPARSQAEDSLTITGDRGLVVVERGVDGRRWAVIPAQDDARVGNYVIVMGR